MRRKQLHYNSLPKLVFPEWIENMKNIRIFNEDCLKANYLALETIVASEVGHYNLPPKYLLSQLLHCDPFVSNQN